jgi:hypothetical protein
MIKNFEMAFKRGLQFEGINLSDKCPCKTCEHLEEVTEKNQYDNKDAERKKYCLSCIEINNWYTNCVAKLREYEKIDNSVKKLKLPMEGEK